MIVLMAKPDRMAALLPPDELPKRPKGRTAVPFPFVLEALAPLNSITRSMFGCQAIYVGDKIVLILRDKENNTADNGLWLATTAEHHPSLRSEFPGMRSIQMFGHAVSSWQLLPTDAGDFEEAALRACELIVKRDPRIGKVPKRRTGGLKKRTKSGSSKSP
jgi:hypothetical protein